MSKYIKLGDYVTPNAYGDISNYKNEYLIQYGNRQWGYNIPQSIFNPYVWRQCVRESGRAGDIALFYNGKLIRSVWNFDKYILGTGKYKCIYKKY